MVIAPPMTLRATAGAAWHPAERRWPRPSVTLAQTRAVLLLRPQPGRDNGAADKAEARGQG
jgi:hypothetical protein